MKTLLNPDVMTLAEDTVPKDSLPEDNEKLVARARCGDRRAFEALVESVRADLERHVRARLRSGLDATIEAHDVLGETYLRAWKAIGRFQWSGEPGLRAWFRTIAQRVILSVAGASRSGELIYLDVAPETQERVPSPSRALRREERFLRLQSAIEDLSPEHREVLLLVRIEGLQVQEAAARLGVSPNAVTQLLRRALAKLKDRFDETESLTLPQRGLGDALRRPRPREEDRKGGSRTHGS